MTAAPLLPEIRIDEQASVQEVRAFLEHDRLLAAYALADLAPSGGEDARWWLARREGQAVACVLLVEMLPFRPCFAVGESEALSAIFREAVREPRIIVATPVGGRLAVESTYRFERCDAMYRMAVNERSFRSSVSHTVVRLNADHLEAVIDLYGNASRSYFTSERLQREIYYGIYSGKTLVSAAGTHVRSAVAGIAAVGNVLTRIAFRGRHMAGSCTSAVTEAALEGHRDVVLNVRQGNDPAIAVYERLGYATHASFVEGPAIRRAAWERLTKQIFGKREH